jgi:hypothetical protein
MFIDHMEPRNITNLTFLGEPLYSFGFLRNIIPLYVDSIALNKYTPNLGQH